MGWCHLARVSGGVRDVEEGRSHITPESAGVKGGECTANDAPGEHSFLHLPCGSKEIPAHLCRPGQ